MPSKDGTGPLGTGPIGGGRGACGAGSARGLGRHLGQMGYGRRQALGGILPLDAITTNKTTLLQQEAQVLRSRLTAVEKELAETVKGSDKA